MRRLVFKGVRHDVEYAVCSDGDCPARTFMELLRVGMWEPDPDAPELPSDAQIEDRDHFLAMCKSLANDGLPMFGSAVNFLVDGMWEFKRGAKRMAFFDTDGHGGYTPKNKCRDRALSYDPDDDEFWWFPVFDEAIRLGHCFPKTGEKTERFDIEETVRVRTEDLAQDV